MRTLKIYGVRDLMEWQAVIPRRNGGALHILFEGGTVSAAGTVPAKYRTDNPVIQALIEGSALYKSGKIRLLSVIASDGVPSCHVAPLKERQAEVSAAAGVGVAAGGGSSSSSSVLRDVVVSDVEGAGKKYLVDNCGVAASRLRSIHAIMEQAAAHGIRFRTE